MKESNNKTVIIIAGPTAVGKTAIAIDIARHFNTEIISADSRQCYKEMAIGVARPSTEELAAVSHHFIASHSKQEEITAVSFEQYALQKSADLFQQHDTVVMVGGTGLYIKAFCEGLDNIRSIDPSIREQILQQYEEKGMEWLTTTLQQKDPAFSAAGEMQNPQRMMRALEVVEATGESILSFRKGEKKERDFNIIKIGLELPREELVKRINIRVDQMIKGGLGEEVKNLIPFKKLNALQTVGYSELFDYFDGSIELELAIEKIKTTTRQYAKRQMTWFKKDEEMKWFSPYEMNGIISWIESGK